MGAKTPGKKIYFGWWIAIAGFIVIALVYGTHVNLAGLFIKPMADDFGVSRTVSATTISIASLAGIAASLVSGRIFSRGHIKRVVVLALVVMGLSYVVAYFATSIWVVFIAVVVRGIAFTFAAVLPLSIHINDWFGKKIRGRVWGFVMMGSGVGGMALSPVAGYIIENWGWRSAYLFCGLLVIPLIPLVLATYVRTPEEKGLKRIGDDPDDVGELDEKGGIPAARAVRTSMFWIFLVGLVLMSGAVQVWTINGLAYLNDLSFNMVQVSIVNSISSAGLTLGKVLVGSVIDKRGIRVGTVLSVSLLVAGYILFCFVGSTAAVAYVMAIVIGAGQVTVSVPPQLLTRDLLGKKGYVTLAGYAQSGVGLGTFGIPILASMVYEAVGSYIPAWVGSAALAVIGLGLILAAYRLQPVLMAKYGQPEEEPAE